MPGPNTTGTPDTRDYLLGRGRVYFAELLPSGFPGAFRDLGNAPEFRISTTEETLKHKSSRSGTAFIDAEVVLSKDTTINFQLDEFNHENLAALFSGEKQNPTNAALAGFSTYEMIASVELGRWYDIVNSTQVRAGCIEAADLTVTNSSSGGGTLVLGTDYELDLEFGRIFFMSTATGISAGDSVDVDLNANAGADVIDAVAGQTRTNVKGALKFISVNPQNNDFEQEFQFEKVSLKADGDTSLIGDDWAVMPFTGTAERNTAIVDGRSQTLNIRNCRPD